MSEKWRREHHDAIFPMPVPNNKEYNVEDKVPDPEPFPTPEATWDDCDLRAWEEKRKQKWTAYEAWQEESALIGK